MIEEPRSCLTAAAPTQWSAQGSRGTRRFSSSTQFWITTNSTDDPLAGAVVGPSRNRKRSPSRETSKPRSSPYTVAAANVKSGSGFENSKLSARSTRIVTAMTRPWPSRYTS